MLAERDVTKGEKNWPLITLHVIETRVKSQGVTEPASENEKVNENKQT